MSPERWQQIEQLYHAALDHAPAGRSSWLAEACAGDGDLRAEVESLLARDVSDPAAFLNQPAVSPGARLGPYEIAEKLGAGGMGEVWKARDTRIGRTVAIKISKTGIGRQLEREARAVAALNHPHIATLYDVGPNFFVMEYVEGHSLREAIPRKGLPLAEALDYAAQIADALATAHAGGIVHRDLKPGNILLTPAHSIKVVDFGLARVLPTASPSAHATTFTQTAEGSIAGTVSYMSPEQARGKPVDARSDIFSFGAVLYEMLTGARAFQGDSAVDVLAEIVNRDPPLPQQIPAELRSLLDRCLRKDPARRWQNMADIRVVLLDLMEGAAAPVAPARSRKPRWIAAAVALVLCAGAGWYLTRPREPAKPMSAPIPLTSYPGEQGQPSFSPDGNQVAFTWWNAQHDNTDIYVKAVGGGEPLRLTTDPAPDFSPAWSPDGRWIAFARGQGGHFALNLVSPLGGNERKLLEFSSVRFRSPSFAWTRDSRHLVVPIQEPATRRNGLFLLTIDSGELHPLTTLDPGDGAGDNVPALSPDDRTLAFLRIRALASGELYTLDLGPDWSPRGAPRLRQPNGVVDVAWTPDGKQLICSFLVTAANAALRRLALFGDSKPQGFTQAGDGAWNPAVSHPPGGGPARLAWARRSQDSNIYRLELAGSPGAETAGNPQAIIASSFRDHTPQYSPDGKRIAFSSARSGSVEIWVCQADGSGLVGLTSLGASSTASPRWSPDGSQIVFDSNIGGSWQVYRANADGGPTQRLTAPPSANFGPRYSPDGRWIYFASDRTGQQNIWRLPASGGPAEQVTRNGGFGAQVSPDNRYLYFTRQTGGSRAALWRMPLAGGAETQVLPLIHRFSYDVTARGIYYSVPQPSTGGTIEFLDPESGRHTVLFHTDKPLDLGLSVSPDGRYLLYPQVDFRGSNLMMIENFR